MRMLLNISIPTQEFNKVLREGKVEQIMGRYMEAVRPEVVYFTEQGGQRGAVMIVDVKDPSQIPVLAEPWYLNFNATVEFKVVMSPEHLKQADLGKLLKEWG